MSDKFQEMIEALRLSTHRLIQGIKRWLFGSGGADDPFAAVRVPTNRNPPSRAGAIALEEPQDDERVEAVGRRPAEPSNAIDHTSRAIAFLRLRKRHCDPNAGICSVPQEAPQGKGGLFIHRLGWEVRFLTGSTRSHAEAQVRRDHEEVLTTGEEWKKTVVEEGWR